jgi:hypothetical protein
MAKLNLRPMQDNYGFSLPEESIATVLKGGKPRIRQDVIGAWKVLDVSWFVDKGDYNYFMAFYRNTIKHGSLPFTIDLIMDDFEIKEYTVQLVPGSLSIGTMRGFTQVITAQLYVQPLPEDSDYDEALVVMYGLYGDQALNIINLLEVTVNTYLPDALGA